MFYFTGTTGMIMSVLTSAIKVASKFVPGVNPRAVEFVCHYIEGSQTPMCLTEKEKDATKQQVLESLLWGRYDPTTAKGWVPTPSYEWLSHMTAGLVGGFLFSTFWEGEYLVAACHDEWDFNVESLGIGGALLPIPEQVPKVLVEKMTKAFGLQVHQNSSGERFLLEEDLVRFNAGHRFCTDWEVRIHWTQLKTDLPEIEPGTAYLRSSKGDGFDDDQVDAWLESLSPDVTQVVLDTGCDGLIHMLRSKEGWYMP